MNRTQCCFSGQLAKLRLADDFSTQAQQAIVEYEVFITAAWSTLMLGQEEIRSVKRVLGGVWVMESTAHGV